MYKRLAPAIVALLMGVYSLVHPPVVAAAMRDLCELQFCDDVCPGDLQAYCLANQEYPCPNPPYTSFKFAQCECGPSCESACGVDNYLIECSYQ